MPQPEPTAQLAPPFEDGHEKPDPAFPIVVGLLMPWLLFLAAFTPRAWWGLAVALFIALGVMLILSAGWAYRRARELDLNPAKWSALTVLTLGTALLLLNGKPNASRIDLLALDRGCGGCGGMVSLTEPFCYTCGEYN